MSRAWDFVTYSCGHSDPVRGGDRLVERLCTSCAACPTGQGAHSRTSHTAKGYIPHMAPTYTPCFRDLTIGQTFVFLDYRAPSGRIAGDSPEAVRKVSADMYALLDGSPERYRVSSVDARVRVTCVDPDHGIGDHPCDEVLGRERAAALRDTDAGPDDFERAREFDRTHPGYWEYRP